MEDLEQVAEVADVVPGRFIFAAIRSYDSFRRSKQGATCMCYSIENELVYEPFASDFGPLNLGCTYRFCQKTAQMLKEAQRSDKLLCFFCGPEMEVKANAAVLIGAFQILVMGRTAEEVYNSIRHMEPFMPFRDASAGPSCFGLTIISTLKGLARGQQQRLLDLRTFDIGDYEFHERVENGDSTWILPGKLLAFSGPGAAVESFYGYKTKVPEDYWNYFKKTGITAVVRLNKALYNGSRFTAGGFRHYELYFPDGSCPTEKIIDQFVEIAERESAVAVHCKAGLGRTGVLICCYMMKHLQFTAREALGYIRVCRPGSVIGPQQNFIIAQEPRMQAAGKAHRMRLAEVQNEGKKSALLTKESLLETSSTNGAPRTVHISASCQSVTLENGVCQLNLDGRQSKASRITSYLRFKPPSMRAWVTSKSSAARVTAPNGQPRKIPAALLAAGEQGLRVYVADEDQPNSASSDQWTITSSRVDDQALDGFSPLATNLRS